MLEILDGLVLALVTVTLLMMQPAELLEHFRMFGVTIENPPVSCFGAFKLYNISAAPEWTEHTYVFLLFMDMTNLKPYVFFVQWSWRIRYNIFETLNAVSKTY